MRKTVLTLLLLSSCAIMPAALESSSKMTPKQMKLITAAADANVEAVTELLNEGVDPNVTWDGTMHERRLTPLHHLIIDTGGSSESRNKNREERILEVARLLLEKQHIKMQAPDDYPTMAFTGPPDEVTFADIWAENTMVQKIAQLIRNKARKNFLDYTKRWEYN